MKAHRLVSRNIIAMLVSLTMSACSVIMAARGEGVEPKNLTRCTTRACLIATGATPIDSEKNKQGKRLSETFRADMPTGSAARAAMHGVLDVATFGVWEVVGTPIEAVKGKKSSYVVVVKYADDGSTIKHSSFEF